MVTPLMKDGTLMPSTIILTPEFILFLSLHKMFFYNKQTKNKQMQTIKQQQQQNPNMS